MFKDGSPT